ncbi:hypothetical protein D3C84_184620 [compost metagenome]|uniref:hypothetical protein n=1 Tax=Pseudomonas sp. ACN8 TaxID=1920428 RepID=UPI000BB3B301|nr:hypothetical protein [Pseudomonas sp. ACN8]PBJ21070.1 hypothetical protein BSF44_37570 [Pseudomonas sp. ACN8]
MDLDEKAYLELDKLQLENRKLFAETRKLIAEEQKLRREGMFYPLLVGAALITAVVSLINLLNKP